MPDFVTDEVRQEISEPANDEIRLALVVGADIDKVKSRAKEYGVTIERELPSGTLIAVVPQETAAEFIDTAILKSVLKPDRMETLS